MQDAEGRSFAGTGLPLQISSPARGRGWERARFRLRKRRAKPGKRPSRRKTASQPNPSLASEGGEFEERRTPMSKQAMAYAPHACRS